MPKTTNLLRTQAKKATRKGLKAKSPKAPQQSRASSNAINLRIDPASRALIDRAAAVAGQTRTDFMLASARTQAELVLLDKVYFELDEAAWKALSAALDNKVPANAALKAAFKTKPLWARE